MAEKGSIDILKSIIGKRNGIARPSKFSALITPPLLSGVTEDLSLLCEAVSLPTRSVMTSDYTSFRNSYKVPMGYANTDVTMTFLLTGDYHAKDVIDRWVGLVVDVPSYRIRYASEFAGRLHVTQLDDELNPIYRVIFEDAFPNSVGVLEFNSGTVDAALRLQVTFSYIDYSVENFGELNYT